MEPGDGHNTNQGTENVEIKVICDRIDLIFAQLSPENSPEIMDTNIDKICRVTEALRSVNPKAYTPRFISIGPLHHAILAKNGGTVMEMKRCFVRRFFSVGHIDRNMIMECVLGLEQKARDCYIEAITMERDEFVELLILDGCFVVMYIICSVFSEFQDNDTSSFSWRFKDAIFRDLLLLENQLPFFVLQSLYNLYATNCPILHEICPLFIQLTHQFFINYDSVEGRISYLLRDFSLEGDELPVSHFVHFLRYMNLTQPNNSRSTTELALSVWPPTATALYDSGISFKNKSLYSQKEFAEGVGILRLPLIIMKNILEIMMRNFGISFKNKSLYSQKVFDERVGILRVPQIIINESFEIMMRNIIAYEHCQPKGRGVCNFAMFMRSLLNTDNDASLLINEGIIHNHLESTKEVTKLFHDLCENVVIIEGNLYNTECKRMREYCQHRRHRWMTSLKRNYFNTPWALISVIAAVLLLLLTILQAVVAVVALYK